MRSHTPSCLLGLSPDPSFGQDIERSSPLSGLSCSPCRREHAQSFVGNLMAYATAARQVFAPLPLQSPRTPSSLTTTRREDRMPAYFAFVAPGAERSGLEGGQKDGGADDCGEREEVGEEGRGDCAGTLHCREEQAVDRDGATGRKSPDIRRSPGPSPNAALRAVSRSCWCSIIPCTWNRRRRRSIGAHTVLVSNPLASPLTMSSTGDSLAVPGVADADGETIGFESVAGEQLRVAAAPWPGLLSPEAGIFYPALELTRANEREKEAKHRRPSIGDARTNFHRLHKSSLQPGGCVLERRWSYQTAAALGGAGDNKDLWQGRVSYKS